MRQRVIDLFSCVGFHHMGLQYAGGFDTVSFCESNVYRRGILARRFPGIEIQEDVRSYVTPGKADIVFGGPPCKNTSTAAAIQGKRSGFTLWPEMYKIGVDAQCECFVVEQPPGNAIWEEQIYRDLSGLGMHVGRLEFSAYDVGAPYRRRRVYIIACADRKRLEVAWLKRSSAIVGSKRAAAKRGDWNPATIPAFGMDTWRTERSYERQQRIEALGDSNPPAMAHVIGLMLQR